MSSTVTSTEPLVSTAPISLRNAHEVAFSVVQVSVEVHKGDLFLTVHIDNGAIGRIGYRVVATHCEGNGAGLGHLAGAFSTACSIRPMQSSAETLA